MNKKLFFIALVSIITILGWLVAVYGNSPKLAFIFGGVSGVMICELFTVKT